MLYKWCIPWVPAEVSTYQIIYKGELSSEHFILAFYFKGGGGWRLAFSRSFLDTSARRSDFWEGMRDPSTLRVRCQLKSMAVGAQFWRTCLGLYPFSPTAKRKATQCSAALIDLFFSLLAAAVFRSELLWPVCQFCRGLFFFILGVVYYFILAKAAHCILLRGKKDKQISKGVWGKRQGFTRVTTLAHQSNGDGNEQQENTALPWEQSNQTEPDWENGTLYWTKSAGLGSYPG